MTDIGAVVDVSVNYEEKTVYVDVASGPNQTHNGIEYRTGGRGIFVVPEFGDVVEIDTVGNGRRVAHSSHTDKTDSMPQNMSEGDIAINLNDNTVLHFKKNGDVYDVDMKCDGELHLDASTITIGENGKTVATKDHTHDYEDTGDTGDGTAGTTTKTTSGPSDTSSTVVE